ncbi:MAG TPA: hypothetical protein VFU89_01150 [Rhabdochlamydiaceae bacterium]|nr:hypothetical protein [Rhabdochlamydiaceae bacterium]
MDKLFEAAKQEQEDREKVEFEMKEEITEAKRKVQILQKSFVAMFFYGFIAGVLSCLAVGTAYCLWRRITVRTGGYSGNCL